MVTESDGIEEAIEGQIRVAITAASRVGEMIARAREESARRAQAASEREARELASRFEAEKQAARVELSSVYRSEWWDKATVDEIGSVYTTARAWAGEDTEAMRAEQRIRDEVRTRYGVDAVGADGSIVPAAMREEARADQARADAAGERRRAAVDEAEAVALLQHADAAERDAAERRAEAEHTTDAAEAERLQATAVDGDGRATAGRGEAELRYDSAERRSGTAQELEHRGVSKDAIAAKMRADVSQAKPATEAVKSAPSRATKARPGRARAAKVQRTEMGR